jgi:hypothetical protein
MTRRSAGVSGAGEGSREGSEELSPPMRRRLRKDMWGEEKRRYRRYGRRKRRCWLDFDA